MNNLKSWRELTSGGMAITKMILVFVVLIFSMFSSSLAYGVNQLTDPSETSIQFGNLVYNDRSFFDGSNLKSFAKDLCPSINQAFDENTSNFVIRFQYAAYGLEQSGKIYMKFPKINDNNHKKEFVCVKVKSQLDDQGVDVILKETKADSHIFKSIGYLKFNKDRTNDYIYGPDIHVSDTGKNSIHVAVTAKKRWLNLGGDPTDIVTAEFMNKNATTTIVLGDFARIGTPGWGGTSSMGPSLLPQTTPRRVCDSDADGDYVCDEYELGGSNRLTIDFDGKKYVGPSCGAGQDPCPNSSVKDVYVEIDSDQAVRPSSAAISTVIGAFKGVGNPWNRPTGTYPAVVLHVQNDESVDAASVSFPSGYDLIKNNNFGTSAERTSTNPVWASDRKAQVYHYVLFAQTLSNDPSSSGWSEIWGNDALVAMGPFLPLSDDKVSGTLMHELGHNLKLDHGGTVSINCKPNYISVLNYIFQFSNLVSTRAVDYSQKALGPTSTNAILNENNALDETQGLVSYGNPVRQTTFGVTASQSYPGGYMTPPVTTGGSINWDNQAGLIANARADINFVSPAVVGCNTQSPDQNLVGYRDWQAGSGTNPIRYNFMDSANFRSGPGLGHDLQNDLTEQDFKNIRHFRIVDINGQIQSIPDTDFVNATEAKSNSNSTLTDILDLVHVNKMVPAITMLDDFKDDITMQITNMTQSDKIVGLIDDVLLSYKKDANYVKIEFDKMFYGSSDTSIIKVEDSLANLESDSVDTIQVNVTSSAQPNGMVITLAETGMDTGIFEEFIQLDPVPALPGNLAVNSNDAITAEYQKFYAVSQISH